MRRILVSAVMAAVSSGAFAAPAVSTSPERVPTPLEVPLARVGTMVARGAPAADDDQWTIGCELLDRDYARFASYKDYLPALGIRNLRFQGGWAKCEREKGRYDFAWLDECVDFARAHGLNPIIETDYGNPIYEGGGGIDLAAGFPSGEEGLAAWDRWVDALSKHFRGRVRDWSMWNEPDLGKAPGMAVATVFGHHSASNIVSFNVRTAKAILANIPDARIAGLSLMSVSPSFNEECYRAFGADVKLFTRFIYHGYAYAPESSYECVEKLQRLCAKYAPHATVWQGENGAPSEMPGDGLALNHVAWSEISQAKWDLRRMLGDYARGIPSAVFSIVDYYHPGRGIGNYGLLRADVAHNDVTAVKRAFYSVQNVVTLFDSSVTRPGGAKATSPENTLQLWTFARAGRPFFVFWTAGEWQMDEKGEWQMAFARPNEDCRTRPAVIEWAGAPLEDPVWVDLLTGKVFAYPKENMLRHKSGVTFVDVPVYDSPCALIESVDIRISPPHMRKRASDDKKF